MSTVVSQESVLIFFLFLSKAAQCTLQKTMAQTHSQEHPHHYLQVPYAFNIKILVFAAAYYSLSLLLIFWLVCY